MDICSPKDGFVLKILVHEGQTVDAGTVIIQMDTESEDMALNRVRTAEAVRVIRSSQYASPQLDVIRELAQLAVERATINLIPAEQARNNAGSHVLAGTYDQVLDAPNAVRLKIAENELKHAVDQQKQLEFAIDRHNEIDAKAKQLSLDQVAFLTRKRDRMTIRAPGKGTIKRVMVADGSFAELGSILVEFH